MWNAQKKWIVEFVCSCFGFLVCVSFVADCAFRSYLRHSQVQVSWLSPRWPLLRVCSGRLCSHLLTAGPLSTPLIKSISELLCRTLFAHLLLQPCEAASSKFAIIYPHGKWEEVRMLLAPFKNQHFCLFVCFYFLPVCTQSLTRPNLTFPWMCLYIAYCVPACMPHYAEICAP